MGGRVGEGGGGPKKYLLSYFSKKLHFHKRNYIITESHIT